MHHLTSPEINSYAEQHTSSESAALRNLNRETNLKVDLPVMLSGHLQGAFLSMISKMIRPENILELGTYTGYSAICLAQGLKEGGHLHTIDINEELSDMCRRYWKEAGVDEQITMHIGKGADIVPKLDVMFDLVFIDADKQNYSNYYDLAFSKVNIGGYILADNVLYDGEVILPASEQSNNAKAIHAFNEKVKADSRVEHMLLPLRDGLMLIRKLSN